MSALLARRGPLVAVILVLSGLLLVPTASAAPASPAAPLAKVKPCKRKKGETKRHWLKRCKCTKFKRGETRAKFKKRCPGAKVPRRTPSSGPGGTTTPGTTTPGGTTTPAGPQPLTGHAAIDYVHNAMKGMRISRVSCTPSSSGGCSSSVTEHIDFCQDGAGFQGRKTTEGLSGYVYEVNFAGNYQILEAQVNAERTLAEARVNVQVTQASGTDDPPQSREYIVTFVGSNQVYLDRQTEYTRGQGQC